jgi:hypothetical protein
MHSVASDRTKMVMSKRNSVPEAMASVSTVTQQRLEQEIAEEDKQMDNAPLSDISSHFTKTEAEDEEVHVKVEIAVSKERILPKRSPFIENLSPFAPGNSDSNPVTP